MRRLLIAAAAGVPLAAAVYLPSASADTGSSASTTTPLKCSSITLRAPEGTEVERVAAVDRPAGTVDVPAIPPVPASQVPDVPAHCDVTVTLTHPGQSDHAQVKVWLPTTGWNGRLQTLGGSAFAAGDYGTGLATAVKNGYAAATTDAGVKSYLDTSRPGLRRRHPQGDRGPGRRQALTPDIRSCPARAITPVPGRAVTRPEVEKKRRSHV
ncbi:hypothetical protein AB0N06_34430 [Streptomyces sp. NPDC051020]|uniref:hypothetical protein n=1 Tax=Streptomyces sp. NPDC051020 TaxID=3155409 RepID=UPI003423E96B